MVCTADKLLQAVLHRLSARLGNSLADAIADMAVKVQDAPGRISREWSLFREEVRMEAERLEREQNGASADVQDSADELEDTAIDFDAEPRPPAAAASPSSPVSSRPVAAGSVENEVQKLVDLLREDVDRLQHRLDGLMP
ncbi:MAG: hypothetical protein ERJ69_02770 [Aphanocapsa feldmannii 288cV]|nr:MAG: hypothetical protein ERJ69_02770 [Aphanocapsa feldmannii 288cV]